MLRLGFNYLLHFIFSYILIKIELPMNFLFFQSSPGYFFVPVSTFSTLPEVNNIPESSEQPAQGCEEFKTKLKLNISR